LREGFEAVRARFLEKLCEVAGARGEVAGASINW
jgi:hypothetical protein